MAAGDGLVSMTPTSIAHSGTSASINADGGVDFTAVTEVSLNGVFTSDYDNYLVVTYWVSGSGGNQNIGVRLRASGSDASGSDYTYQTLTAVSTSVSGQRLTSETSWLRLLNTDDAQSNGWNVHFYGPALAQPTAARSVGVFDFADASIRDTAGTHSLSTAYDGFTILASGASLSGNIHVFGYEE